MPLPCKKQDDPCESSKALSMTIKSHRTSRYHVAIISWYRKNGPMIFFEGAMSHTVTFNECNDDCTEIESIFFPVIANFVYL